MRINTNINSMRTQEYMRQSQEKMNTAMNRLSSGKRINSAADDAAGLAIATRMRARESGLAKATQNTQDGMSLIRTAESALGSISNILTRMRDLAVQSANGVNNTDNQTALDNEFKSLQDQIDYVSTNTEFNGKKLLNGDSTIAIETLDSDDAAQQITVDLKLSNAEKLTVKRDDVKIDTTAEALKAVKAVDGALAIVATNRAGLGATLNRLGFNVENLNSQSTNMASSASQIEDADMAKEMSEMTKFKILNEAGISMLSQANQTPQMISKLLQ
ncbi:flagellin [Bacillus thuringiensis]